MLISAGSGGGPLRRAAAAAGRGAGGAGWPSSLAENDNATGLLVTAVIGVRAAEEIVGGAFGLAVTESRLRPARFWL